MVFASILNLYFNERGKTLFQEGWQGVSTQEQAAASKASLLKDASFLLAEGTLPVPLQLEISILITLWEQFHFSFQTKHMSYYTHTKKTLKKQKSTICFP